AASTARIQSTATTMKPSVPPVDLVDLAVMDRSEIVGPGSRLGGIACRLLRRGDALRDALGRDANRGGIHPPDRCRRERRDLLGSAGGNSARAPPRQLCRSLPGWLPALTGAGIGKRHPEGCTDEHHRIAEA